MAIVKSAQMDKIGATPPTRIKRNESGGSVQKMWWDFTTAATDGAGVGPVAAADVIELGYVPAGARIIGGRVTFGAMGTGALASIGTEADPDRYLNDLDVAAAAESDFAHTKATDRNFGEVLTAETKIVAKNEHATVAWATTSKIFNGYIEYMI